MFYYFLLDIYKLPTKVFKTPLTPGNISGTALSGNKTKIEYKIYHTEQFYLTGRDA